MDLRIIRYAEEYRLKWNEFVLNSFNGTFLHSRDFFDHNPSNAGDEHSFIFLDKDTIVGLLPCNLYETNKKKILHSYLRATYGGFVVNKEVGASNAVEMVSLLKNEAVACGVDEIIIRNPFRIFASNLCDETDYAMWYHGFEVLSRELETVIKLGEYHETVNSYNSSTKRNIKRARQTLVINESRQFDKYWEVLNKNLSEKYGLTPTHTYEAFLELIKHVGDEKIKLFVACLDGNIIGGIVLFIANKTAIHAQYICSDSNYQELRPLNAVIDEIVKWGCQNSFKYLNLGTSNYNSGKALNEGLFRFKEGFGGRNVLRETMHLVL